jgi:hypothetical protein
MTTNSSSVSTNSLDALSTVLNIGTNATQINIGSSNTNVNTSSINLIGNFTMPSSSYMNVSNASFIYLSVKNINGTPYNGVTNVSQLINTNVMINTSINASNAYFSNLSVQNLTTTTINNTIINSYSSPTMKTKLYENIYNNNFGSSIVFNQNNQLIVGCNSKLQIYSFTNSSWTNVSTINGDTYVGFGSIIGLSTDGTVLACGKPTYTGLANTNEYYQGAVDIYKFSSNNYKTASRINVSTIKFNNANSKFMVFGKTLALSGNGNTLVVGSPNFSFGGGNADILTFGIIKQGRVDIFNYNNTSWVNISTMYGSNTQTGGTWDGLGQSCAINSTGTIVAVGSNNFSNNRGKIEMFEYTTSWIKTQTVFGSGDYEYMGRSCAMNSNGTILCVGCGQSNGGGRAYIYNYSNSTLSNVSIINGEGNEALGSSCAMNSTGDVVCLGCNFYTDNGTKIYGRVKIYKFTNGWYNTYRLFDADTALYNNNGYFGTTCALSSDGTTFAGGAPSSYLSLTLNNAGLVMIRTISTMSNIALSNNNVYNTSMNTMNTMNIVISDNGLISNVNGGYNTIVGMNSMISNINGSNNTAFGYNTLTRNTGSNNVAIGSNAEQYSTNVNSNNNIAIGYNAMTVPNALSTTLVTNSTAIGANANCSGFSYSTAIGFNASNIANNQIVLGNGTEQVYIAGNLRVIGTVTGTYAYNTGSDFRIKENISYINKEYDISKLKPCEFNYINSSKINIGFIAQDVEKVIPLSVVDNDLKGIDYSALTSASIITIQKLLERVDILEQTLNENNIS